MTADSINPRRPAQETFVRKPIICFAGSNTNLSKAFLRNEPWVWSQHPRFTSWLCCSLALWPEANCSVMLGCSFLTCATGILIPTMKAAAILVKLPVQWGTDASPLLHCWYTILVLPPITGEKPFYLLPIILSLRDNKAKEG